MVDNPPRDTAVINPKLVAVPAYVRHRTRRWHTNELAILQSSQQKTGFEPCNARESRRLHLTMQLNQRFVASHRRQSICQERHIRKTRANFLMQLSRGR
jgi:hypothetical protein